MLCLRQRPPSAGRVAERAGLRICPALRIIFVCIIYIYIGFISQVVGICHHLYIHLYPQLCPQVPLLNFQSIIFFRTAVPERTIIKCWGVVKPRKHGISSGNGIAGWLPGIGVRKNLQETRINLGAHTMVSDQGNLPNKTNPASSANPISFLGYSYISILPKV